MRKELTLRKLSEFMNSVPNANPGHTQGIYMYTRKVKGLFWYEFSRRGVPFLRLVRRGVTFESFCCVRWVVYGGWIPGNENNVGRRNTNTFSVDGMTLPRVVGEQKPRFRDDIRNYIKKDFRTILAEFNNNMVFYEDAYSNGWLEYYRGRMPYETQNRSFSEMMRLPNMSRKQIMKVFDMIEPYEFYTYIDYHRTYLSLYGKRMPESLYYVKCWKGLHEKHNEKLNRVSNATRRRNERMRKKGFDILEKSKQKDIKVVGKPKTKDDLVVLGRKYNNCVRTYEPEPIYEVVANGVGLCCEMDGGKLKQAKMVSNYDIPVKTFRMVERAIMKYNEKEAQNEQKKS